MDIIKIKHTSIVIPKYNLGDNIELEKMLSIWNEAYYRYEPIGFSYKKNTKELLIPRGINSSLLENRFNLLSDIDYDSDPYEKAVYKLKVEPRNDIQKRGISFLIGEENFKFTKKYSQLALTFDTGDGKTYIAIAALTIMKVKSIIITPITELRNQWAKEFLTKTNIDEKHICIINGSPDIDKLFKAKKLNYKVYLVNHGTIHSYGKQHGWEAVSELFKLLKVGVKIIDEAHWGFENIINIDLYTNTKKTFYVTANFDRTDYRERKLFDMCFNSVIRYGIEERIHKIKHIKYLAVLYNSKPSLVDVARLQGRYGFDKNFYIDYEIQQDIFFSVIEYLINLCIGKGKILIMLSKIEPCNILYHFLIELFPDSKIAIYNSSIPHEIRKLALEAEIIVSTPKSLGIGVDIDGLRYVINTEQYSSKIKGNQVAGRLRYLGKDIVSHYIEVVDIGFKYAYNLYRKRKPIFKEKCTSLNEYKFNQ
jgi:hypothetical protein